jgi:hypothetical protein
MAAVTRSAATAKALDFTDVKDGGASFNKKRVPMGDYLAKVTKCEDSPTKETKEPQWLYTIELVEKYTDRKFPYYCKLQANQLWKVRNLFLAAGISIPKRKVKLDPNRVVGKLVGLTLEDDEYDGKMQSNIAQFFPASDLTEGEDPEDELDDEEAEDEDEAEEEPAPVRRKARPAPEPEPEEEEDEEEEAEEEDEEEEEPAPVRRKAPAKASIPAQRKASPAVARKKVAARPAVEDVDEDDLEALDLDEI